MSITQAPNGGATLDPALTNNPTAVVESYADAVQRVYREQQARMASSGVEEAPIDYSMAGLSAAGLWTMSQADKDANAARAQSVLADPASTQAAKDLVSLPGYGTAEFDKSLNDGSNPTLLKTVQNLLSLSSQESTTGGNVAATPTGTAGTSGGGDGTITQAPGGNTGDGTSVSGGGSAVDRLLDIAAMMYASAGTSGGGTGFGGLTSGPIATDVTGGATAPAASSSSHTLVIFGLVAAGLAFWYYKKHHKKGS